MTLCEKLMRTVERNALLYANYFVNSSLYWSESAWKYSMWCETKEDRKSFEVRAREDYLAQVNTWLQLANEARFARRYLPTKIPEEVVEWHVYPFLFYGVLRDPELGKVLKSWK